MIRKWMILAAMLVGLQAFAQSNANQVMVRAWQTANLAGFPSALAMSFASAPPPPAAPSNADQVLSEVYDRGSASIRIYCVSGCPTGTINIGTAIGGSTPGSVLFVDAGGALGQDPTKFFYNITNKTLIVGSNTFANRAAIAGILTNPGVNFSQAVNGIVTDNTNVNNIIGVYGEADSNHAAGGRVSARGGDFEAYGLGAGTTTRIEGLTTYAENDAGTATNLIGGHFTSNFLAGGAATNNYGILVDDQEGVATNNWDMWVGKTAGFDGLISGYNGTSVFSSLNSPDSNTLMVKSQYNGTVNHTPLYSVYEATHTAGTQNNSGGFESDVYQTGAGGTINSFFSIYGYHEGDAGTAGNAMAVGGTTNVTNTSTNVADFQSDGVTVQPGGTLTNGYGVWIKSNVNNGAAYINNYGMKIENQAGVGGTKNSAITTGTGTIDFGDKVATYQGIATAGNGQSAIRGVVDLTGQTVTVGPANLLTGPAQGMYRVTSYSNTVTVAGGACTMALALDWTDSAGAKTQTLGNLNLNSATDHQDNSNRFWVESGNVTYTATVSGAGCGGLQRWDLHIRAESL